MLAAVAIAFWSTVSVVTKLLLNAYSSFQVLWLSSFFAAVALFLFNLFSGELKRLKSYTPKDYLVSTLIGLPGSLFYYVFFYAGASRMLASQAFIVNYLWPIMSVLCACIILKERMTVKKGVAIGLSFLGVVIVMWRNLLSFDRNTLVGAALCVLGAVSYGLFTSLNQKKQYNKSLSMMLNYTATFVLTSVITAVSGDLFFPTAVQVVGFAWNGVLTMALANTAWIMALSRGETAKISNLVYITPFLSLLWTWLVLREPLEINFIAGLAIIVLGILIQLSKVPLCALALRRSDGKR